MSIHARMRSNLELTNLPQNRDLQEYQAALDRYLRQVAGTEALKAVYRLGSFEVIVSQGYLILT